MTQTSVFTIFQYLLYFNKIFQNIFPVVLIDAKVLKINYNSTFICNSISNNSSLISVLSASIFSVIIIKMFD